MPASDDIILYRGEQATLEFVMDPVEDITGWTLEFNGPGIASRVGTVTSPSGGKFTFELDTPDTKELAIGRYLYDVWRVDEGAQQVLARGDFVVERPQRVVA